MPIEFRCSQCGKLLRTGDDTAGRQAQCPECGSVTLVPSASQPSESPVPPSAPPEDGNPFGSQPAAGGESSDNPYLSPAPVASLLLGQLDPIAAQRVAGPAIALMVTAILGMVAQALRIVSDIFILGMNHGLRQRPNNIIPLMFTGGVGVGVAIVGLIVGMVVLLGAMKMRNLENYSFAVAASIIAMVPCFSPCCLLGLPFGIWALVVLNDGAVKAAFRS